MKPQSLDTRTISSPTLSMHDYSHTISKQKPKIRIIHIVAPEVINTDIENFRDLVQRLTGKPNKQESASSSQVLLAPKPEKKTKNTQTIMKKEIEEMYTEDNPNAYSGFFSDMDGFFQDMNEHPLLSLRSLSPMEKSEGGFYSSTS